MAAERCSWCERGVDQHEGFRAWWPAQTARAVFCRLEHVVPWAMRDVGWIGDLAGAPDDDGGLGRCARCGERLGAGRVLLVRHRGEHRIGDSFCGVEHLVEWAKAGGRWA